MKLQKKHIALAATRLPALIIIVCAIYAVWGAKNVNVNSGSKSGNNAKEIETPADNNIVRSVQPTQAPQNAPVAERARQAENTPAASDAESGVSAERLSRGATIVYEFSYTDDGVVLEGETFEEALPRFLTGKTLGEVSESFGGWQVAEFSPERVVLRKMVDKNAKSYIIGIYAGCVAVFLGDGELSGGVLKMSTGKPVSALSDDERARLTEGVKVVGEEALFRVLEDYGS